MGLVHPLDGKGLIVSLESGETSLMRALSRLHTFIAGFCLLGSASVAVAQGEIPSSGETAALELPALTELKVLRSSRSDVPDTITVETAEIPEKLPRIVSKKDADRLMRNEGVSLQWIDWDERGPAWVAVTTSGHWLLMAGQYGGEGGTLDLEGFITEVGEDYFVFEGTIKMLGTPDQDRVCRATKPWRFEVTQGRSYYRLREFEWCDYLTDYIDVYFDPALR